MNTSHEKIVLVNPPMDLPSVFIDNPAYNFVPVVITQHILAEHHDVVLVDSFIDGKITRLGNRISLGRPVEKLLHEILACNPDRVIIHYSSFMRAEGLENDILTQLIDGLSTLGCSIVLADIYEDTTHYIDYEEDVLKKLYPAIQEVYKHAFPFNRFGLSNPVQKGRFPVTRAAVYKDWLALAIQNGIIKDGTGESVFPYRTSTGCPYSCLFCKEASDHCIKIPMNDVQYDLIELNKLGFQIIHVTDSYVNYDVKRFKELLRFCTDRGIRLHFTNGIGIRDIDEETAALVAGVEPDVFLSPESLIPDSLKTLRKPFDRDSVLRILDVCYKQGLRPRTHFIIGVPGENRRDTNRMLDEIWDLAARYGIQPFFQVYTSRDKLKITTERCRNIYDQFFPETNSDKWIHTAHAGFTHKSKSETGRKIIINVSYRCNNNCSFCAIGDRERIDGDVNEQIRLIREAHAEGIELLDIDGGEPLLYDDLFNLLDVATDYKTVTITTNGRMLAYKELVKKLAGYSAVKLLISLHGPDAEHHDNITRSPGSFEQTIAGLKNAVLFFDDIGVNMTITSLNYTALENTADVVASLGVKSFNIQWYAPFGIVDASLCSPPGAVEHIRRVVARFNRIMRISLVNFTYCQASDLSAYMSEDYFKATRRMHFVNGELVNLADYLSQRREKTDLCLECPYCIICRGFWVYSQQQGGTKRALIREESQKGGAARKYIRLLDIIPGYSCNSKCIYCTATESMRDINLYHEELIVKIQDALALYTPAKSRIGGGEPTLRQDLSKIISYLHSAGVHDVSIQTNGLMLSYEKYADLLVRAGLTRVNISIAGGDENVLRRLSGVEGAFDMKKRAVINAAGRNIPVEIDALLTKFLVDRLDEFVDIFSNIGVKKFNFWFISIEGNVLSRVDELVPRISSAARKINELIDTRHDIDIKSYYIPYCFFPEHINNVWHPMEENAFVITPGESFFLEKGQIDVGIKLPECSGCYLFNSCPGIRENYVAIFGTDEFHKITNAMVKP